MKRQIKKIISVLLTVCFVLSITAATVSAKAGNPNPGVLPVNSNSHGKTYGEWSEEWWKWALSIPASSNPMTDETGAFSAEGQSGNVWFLAGTFGQTGVVRSCTIPTGKAVFFPVINVVAYEENGILSETDIAETKEFIDNVTVTEVRVDGTNLKDLDNYRVRSEVFLVTLPENNILGIPAGPTRSLSDGYWIMLTPLPKGQHEIYIHGVTNFRGFIIGTEVTYKLNVTK